MSEENNIEIENIDNNKENLEQENDLEQNTTINDNLALDKEAKQADDNEDSIDELTDEEIEELEQATNEGRKLNGVQKKINKFYERAKTAEEQLQTLRAENEQLRANIAPEQPLVEPVEPDELDFDNTQDFLEAKKKYRQDLINYGEKVGEIKAKHLQQIEPVVQNLNNQLKKIKADFPDFAKNGAEIDRLAGDLSLDNKLLNDVMFSSPHGALILKEICKDVAYGVQISKMSKTDIPAFYREIGKIEAKLSLSSSKIETGLKQQPRPITPVNGTSAGGDMSKEATLKRLRAKGII